MVVGDEDVQMAVAVMVREVDIIIVEEIQVDA
jgi:hypothetical protein